MKLFPDQLVVNPARKEGETEADYKARCEKERQVIKFEKYVLNKNELMQAETEGDPEYCQRMKKVLQGIKTNLNGWDGRGESEGDQTTVIDGPEGALNMGIDLALRQINRPKKVGKQSNRENALSWAADQEGDIFTGLVAATKAKTSDKYADELIAKYGTNIPGVVV